VLTPEGLAHIWAMLTGQSDDSLAGGFIEVGAGSDTDRQPIRNFVVAQADGATRLTVDAEFGEERANFDWSQRSVLTKQGVVIDVEADDGGRKAVGSVWEIEIDIDLVAGTGTGE
jgi:hypothetical protein